MKPQEWVLISNAVSFGEPQRAPLRRIVLPRPIAALLSGEGCRRIWWIEAKACARYLRAIISVPALVGEAKQGDRVSIDIDVENSERLSWPGDACFKLPRGFSLLPQGLSPLVRDRQEELKQALVDSQPIDVRQGLRELNRLLARTICQRPALPANPTFSYGLSYVRAYFSRSELPHVEGFDPYIFSAQGICGVEPKAAMKKVEPLFFGFEPRVISAPSSPQDVAVVSTRNALAAATSKHHQLVDFLARQLSVLGCSCSRNQFVDLKAEKATCDFFFEVKTATYENFLHQVRTAVGQLLEYRFRFSMPGYTTRLIAAVEPMATSDDLEFAKKFVASLGIELLLLTTEKPMPLRALLA